MLPSHCGRHVALVPLCRGALLSRPWEQHAEPHVTSTTLFGNSFIAECLGCACVHVCLCDVAAAGTGLCPV